MFKCRRQRADAANRVCDNSAGRSSIIGLLRAITATNTQREALYHYITLRYKERQTFATETLGRSRDADELSAVNDLQLCLFSFRISTCG